MMGSRIIYHGMVSSSFPEYLPASYRVPRPPNGSRSTLQLSSRPRSRAPNEHWLHLTGAEQIAKVAILTFLGRKKVFIPHPGKAPFSRLLVVVLERILTSLKRNKIIARKI